MLTLILAAAVASDTTWTFDGETPLEEVVLHASGEAARRMPLPKILDGKLYLLESWWKSDAQALFPETCGSRPGVIEVSFDLVMNTGTEGFGLALLDTAQLWPWPLEVANWEAPSLPGAFGIGFDASNPPNRDPFRGSGNVYDRPQHEVSLHWDGTELVKRTAKIDFRDEEPHHMLMRIAFVVGGAEVTVLIDEETVYEDVFLAGVKAFVPRLAMGARNAETAGDVLVDEVTLTTGGEPLGRGEPMHLSAIGRQLNDSGHHKTSGIAFFPDDTSDFGRITCTLRLEEPPGGYDPWDRLAHVWIEHGDGERTELIRYITPYDRGWEWTVDVSDFRPLLSGPTKIVQECATYASGWLVSVEFDLWPGPAQRLATQVVSLWSGAPEIGNPDNPSSAFHTPRSIRLPEGVSDAKVRMAVTGHGMFPNANNAAEFMPIWRTLTVNGESFRNQLWKSDNYLNPCRPQGGTWKYDRAGWAPGDVAAPWEVEVGHLLGEHGNLDVSYALDPYINETRGETWAPNHRTESYLILFTGPAGDQKED